MCCYATLLA
ncbi:hypothetical protein LINPERPRIM_LOCUS29319 [Linum perenne]